jgi:membrane protease YdiL (CAAX protease family)
MIRYVCSACGAIEDLHDSYAEQEIDCRRCRAFGIAPQPLPEQPVPPHPGFWWAVLWCLGILLVTQLLPGIVGVMIVIASGKGLEPELLENTQALMRLPEYVRAMMWALLLSQVLSIGLAWLSIRIIVGKEWPRILALRLPSLSHVVLAVMGLPGLIVVSMGIEGLAKQLPSVIDLDQVMEMFGKWPWQVGVLLIGLGPGIGEELWFRGFFGRGLVGRYGVVAGVVISSVLFGLIHVEPRQAIVAMVIGVFLHLSYLASRSLLVPMFLHMANNSLSILASRCPELSAIDVPPEQVPWYVYSAGVVLVAAVGWAFFKSRALLVDRTESGDPAWRPAFPGVECPPRGTATRVVRPMPDGISWSLAFVGFALFAAVVVPTAIDLAGGR